MIRLKTGPGFSRACFVDSLYPAEVYLKNRDFVCPYTLSFMKYIWFCAVSALLISIAVYDIRQHQIPDRLLLLLALSGLSVPGLFSVSHLAGALCVSLPLLIFGVLVPGSFGGGDVKLLAAGGWILGVRLAGRAFACGMFLAGVFCLILLLTGRAKRNTIIPLAPFLCAGIEVIIFLNEFD